MEPEKYDPIKCIACSIGVEHSQDIHQKYISIWCDKHKTWCGDHTQTTIKEQLEKISPTVYQSFLKRNLNLDGKEPVKLENHDFVKCLACSIGVKHSEELHDSYLAIWCEKHKSWCGDHTKTSIKGQLEKIREQGRSLKDLKNSLDNHLNTIEQEPEAKINR